MVKTPLVKKPSITGLTLVKYNWFLEFTTGVHSIFCKDYNSPQKEEIGRDPDICKKTAII